MKFGDRGTLVENALALGGNSKFVRCAELVADTPGMPRTMGGENLKTVTFIWLTDPYKRSVECTPEAVVCGAGH